MVYKITMQNVGRNQFSGEKVLDRPPTYADLHSMVFNHLASSEIDFVILNEEQGKETGKVRVGGWRFVGDFAIEQQSNEGGALGP